MDEVGKVLKEARIEKGYTLDDLQQITKIQKRYLQAIEDGNMDILPGRFYARAFIKQYADIVDLDGEELLKEQPETTPEEAQEEFSESVSAAPTRTQETGTDFLKNIQEYIPMILIFLLVLAIGIVIFFAFRQGGSGSKPEEPMINEIESDSKEDEDKKDDEDKDKDDKDLSDEDQEDDEEDEEVEDEIQEIEVSESTGGSTTYEVKGARPDKQTITLTGDGGDTWVSISTSEGAYEDGLLTDGESMSVEFGPETTEINLVIGNGSATKVTLDDQEIEQAPEAKEIYRQEWTIRFVD